MLLSFEKIELTPIITNGCKWYNKRKASYQTPGEWAVYCFLYCVTFWDDSVVWSVWNDVDGL